MKRKYIPAGNKNYQFKVWTVLAFGYHVDYANYDSRACHKSQYWYFLFFKVTCRQYLTIL